MSVWLVRAGRNGENEDFALENHCVVWGGDEVGDLTHLQSPADVESRYRTFYPNAKPKTIKTWAAQGWAFCSRIQEGDLAILPLKTRSAIAVGKVTGSYQWKPANPDGAKHTRPVKWIRTDIPRSDFHQDVLYSLGAFMAVCRIQRHGAEERIKAVLEGRPMPDAPMAGPEPSDDPTELIEALAPADLEGFAADQIRNYVGSRFRAHNLTRLVAACLKAQGYQVQQSPAGRDGGVDIIAGHGPMGFDPPRLCVQVKSSDTPIDVNVLRELQGVMGRFGAHQGLLVSWGGFKSSVIQEARQLFFEIRLWDAGQLMEALLENYERLPEDLQAEFPLKRIWTLVSEEEEE